MSTLLPLSHAYASVRLEVLPDEALENALRDGCEVASRALPAVQIDPSALVRFVAERTEFDGARWSDLALAWACSRGDSAALDAFESRAMSDIRGGLGRLRLAPDAVDEALQVLRRDLFTGDDPKILAYSGHGDLIGWAKVVATRIALKIARKTKREVSSDEIIANDAAGDGDPELMLFRAHYQAAFRAAVERGIAELDPRDALLIKQNTVDGLSIDELGALHGVHRATAARWLQKARETLVEQIRNTFQSNANLSTEECQSALRLVQSRFDMTLRRHLERAASNL